MRYRRAMLLTEVGADTETALAAVRSLAREAEHLFVAACPPSASDPDSSGAGAAGAWLERVRVAARAVVPSAEVGFLPELDTEALQALVEATRIDLVVAGPRPSAAIPVLARLHARHPVAILWVPASAALRDDRPFATVLGVALGIRALRGLAAFLRDHGGPELRVALLSLRRPPPDEFASGIEVAGVRASVKLIRPGGTAPLRALENAVRENAVELVVLPRFVPSIVRAQRLAPVLVPPLPVTPRHPAQRPLDIADPVDLGDAIRVRIGSAYGVGRNAPIPDQEVAFVSGGARGRDRDLARRRSGAAVRGRGARTGRVPPRAGDHGRAGDRGRAACRRGAPRNAAAGAVRRGPSVGRARCARGGPRRRPPRGADASGAGLSFPAGTIAEGGARAAGGRRERRPR